MDYFSLLQITSLFFMGLVSGFLFAFSVVVMPGLKSLNDESYVECFGSIDEVIQKGSVPFLIVWGGSFLSSLVLLALIIYQGVITEEIMSVISCVLFLLCVQAETVIIHLPLNKRLQEELKRGNRNGFAFLRRQFEKRWVPWNSFRTLFALISFLLMLVESV